MALTIGTGPFGEHPSGRFDVTPPARPLLFWEPFRKRLRVVVADETIVDTRQALALHETGEMMRIAVPAADLRGGPLTWDDVEPSERLGLLRTGTLHGGAVLARAIERPPAAAAPLAGHVLLDLDKADAWYLEDELGYAHPRDPYHRFDVHRASRRVVVRVGDTIVAETHTPVLLFETSTPTRVYLPPDAIRPGLLVRSETVSRCPYKGDGRHWHVVTNGRHIADAAWSLTTPMGDALTIARWVSFYPDKVTVEVDGALFDHN